MEAQNRVEVQNSVKIHQNLVEDGENSTSVTRVEQVATQVKDGGGVSQTVAHFNPIHFVI